MARGKKFNKQNTGKKAPAKKVQNIQVSQKQYDFITCTADEVLYGGSAGSGKSYSILIDAYLYANQYAGSKQLILRETFPELERSLILVSLTLYPEGFATYNGSDHKWYWYNGSIIEFGYLENDTDVMKYQSAEYDRIYFDEATHFNEHRFTYMKSRLRGANSFPKQIKAGTNPGGIGHKFFKSRFKIGVEESGKPFSVFIGKHPQTGEDMYETRCFIPAKVFDNQFLMKDNPGYVKNLMQLPENERKALLDGSWEIFDDQAFPMFSRSIHVIEPFPIPRHWKRWRSVDNGYNDPFAWYWNAVDEFGTIYTYREYTRTHDDPKVIYSKQAEKVVEKSTHVELIDGKQVEYQEKFQFTVAGLDAWATHVRDQQGKTLIDYYNEGGVYGFVKAITDRRLRKATIIEYLTPHKDENLPEGQQMVPKVKIFSTCKHLIQDINDAINDPDDPEKYCDDASVGGAHWCVTGDTLIDTTKGKVSIRDLVGKTGEVYCYDEDLTALATESFYNVSMTQQGAEIFEIELENGRLFKATKDHPVLTKSGWKSVGDLTESDEIVCVEGIHDVQVRT